MNNLWRIIDADSNRAAEGLRVLEDYVRFYWDDETLQKELRDLRHAIRKIAAKNISKCLQTRNSVNDVGFKVSAESKQDTRTDLKSVILANCSRAQESCRALEETYKLLQLYTEGKTIETIRASLYELEKKLMKKVKPEIRINPLEVGLYGLTAEEYSLRRSNIETVRAMLENGIKIIQYREKDKSKKEAIAECKELRKLTKAYGALFIINDDPIIAIEVDADGVHMGQDDYPPTLVRNILGNEKIIGLSTHSPEQAREALEEDIDYIGVGPIYATKTKKNVCDPVGLEYLDYVVNNIDIPFVAIGGIKEHNIQEVLDHGARTVALVTEIVGSDDIPEKIKNLKNKWR